MNYTTASKPLPPGIDERDAEILQAVSDGLEIKTIADKFGIHHTTAGRALSRVLCALNAKSIPHAVKLAERQGVIR